jgi:Protein of unknown function (DUF1569)
MKSLASADVLSETRGRLLRVCADDRALWGKMTATQMVRHLGIACEIPLGERMVEPVMGPAPRIVKFVALRSGLRWPKNLKSTSELVRALDEGCSAEFDELVAVAVKKMEELAGRTRCVASHPMFGPMTAGDWMRWGYLHADHHLRQFGR